MLANKTTLNIDGFIISQDLYNQITANALFGIEKEDESHLGHDEITWTIDDDIKCNDCNMCDSCQGECYDSCYDSCASCDECLQCTSACVGSCDSECFNCAGGCTATCYSCDGCQGACTEGCVSRCYSCQNYTGPTCWTNCFDKCQGACTAKCQSACYSSCQGGCTTGCNSCQDCQGSCTADCQGSCYSACAGGCTSGCHGGCQGYCYLCTGGCADSCYNACQGSCTSTCASGCFGNCQAACAACTGCTSCETCVGSNCNSCNGSCTGIVDILCTGVTDSCPSCYMSCQGGCTTQCAENTARSETPFRKKSTAKIKSITSVCFAEQNGGYDKDAGSDHGYGGLDKLTVVVEVPDKNGNPKLETIEITVPGEERDGKVKGSSRTEVDAYLILKQQKAQIKEKLKENGYTDSQLAKMELNFDDTDVELYDDNGKLMHEGKFRDGKELDQTIGVAGGNVVSHGWDANGHPTITVQNGDTGEIRTHTGQGCSSLLH